MASVAEAQGKGVVVIPVLIWLGGCAMALGAVTFAMVTGARSAMGRADRETGLPFALCVLLAAVALLSAYAAGRLAARAASLDVCATDVCIITIAEGDFE